MQSNSNPSAEPIALKSELGRSIISFFQKSLKPPPSHRCPYCLESIREDLEKEAKTPSIQCPICRHVVPWVLAWTPVHLFDREQQWEWLAREMDYIWSWKHTRFFNDRHPWTTYACDFGDEKEMFEAFGEGMNKALSQKERLFGLQGDLDRLLEGYLIDHSLAMDFYFSQGRGWREKARDLSERNAASFQITLFQRELIKATPWEVYGINGTSEKERVLKILEDRMGKRD